MSQTSFLRDFDALAFGAFMATGMADAAMYTAPAGGAAVACQVLVDRDVRNYGDDLAPVATSYTLVSFQRSQVQPSLRGVVLIEGESFELAQEVLRDESVSRWVVTRV